MLATEPVQRFFAYGRPILAPADGVVVQVHDGEIDHQARRSQLALVPHELGQRARLRHGVAAIAAHHLILALQRSGAFVVLAHLRAGSMRVAVGEEVRAGQPKAECGNPGNSTQPHLHVQVMDSPDLSVARGIPMAFRRFREWPGGAKQPRIKEGGLPSEGAVAEPLPATTSDADPSRSSACSPLQEASTTAGARGLAWRSDVAAMLAITWQVARHPCMRALRASSCGLSWRPPACPPRAWATSSTPGSLRRLCSPETCFMRRRRSCSASRCWSSRDCWPKRSVGALGAVRPRRRCWGLRGSPAFSSALRAWAPASAEVTSTLR